jgi:RNA polymerase sigma-70 factor (ECF subfamily)
MTILERIQHSDESAFEELFRTYYQGLCNYGNSILKDMDEAEEVVQNVFCQFWEKRESLDIQISLKSYLYKMVHNACLNKLKHQKVKNVYEQYQMNIGQGYSLPASHLAIENELEGKIKEAINALPEQCRIIFCLSRYEELKYAEIANQLDISVKTVENQMGKALRILREKLSDYLFFLILLGLNNTMV